MLRLFRALFAGPSPIRSQYLRSSATRSSTPAFHPLERRRLLSASFDQGVLALTGTVQQDKITIRAGDLDGQVVVFGIDGLSDGTVFDSVDAIEIDSADGNDRIKVADALRASDGLAINVTVDAGSGDNRVTTNSGDDIVVVGHGRNKVKTGDGSDHVTAGDGVNRIDTGAGNDVVIAGAGGNKIKTWDGDDIISSGIGRDNIKSGHGDDVIDDQGGDNNIKSSDGDDSIRAGSGRDKINAGAGMDIVDGGGGNDRVRHDEGSAGSTEFWHHRQGKELIRALNGGPESTALSDWLASRFTHIYGVDAGANDLTGKTNAEVAEFYEWLYDGNNRGEDHRGSSKTDVRVMATALSVYVTTESLAGRAAASYGFNVTAQGMGVELINVGTKGAAFGIANFTDVAIIDLLDATDERTTAGLLYDLDGDRDASDDTEHRLRGMAHDVYGWISDDHDNDDSDDDSDDDHGHNGDDDHNDDDDDDDDSDDDDSDDDEDDHGGDHD